MEAPTGRFRNCCTRVLINLGGFYGYVCFTRCLNGFYPATAFFLCVGRVTAVVAALVMMTQFVGETTHGVVYVSGRWGLCVSNIGLGAYTLRPPAFFGPLALQAHLFLASNRTVAG